MMLQFIFDLYGTLIDIHTDESSPRFWDTVASLLGEYGGTQPPDGAEVAHIYHMLCQGEMEEKPPFFECDLMRVFRNLLTRYGAPDTDDTAQTFATRFRLASMRHLSPFPHVREMLMTLRKRGCGVYLLSNAQACFTHKELEDTALFGLFDGVLLSSEVGWKKPSPRFFDCIQSVWHLSPEDCIYVGNDLRDDILGATEWGIPAVYIPTPQSGEYAMEILPTYRVAPADFQGLETCLLSLI